tara:strand:- start:20 stop:1069 length:1050 start_codon:yes stop_codon:yes gene_type:complete
MAYAAISKPSLHIKAKNYTGTGAIQAVTGVGFQPDFIWGKNRGATSHYYLADVLRGVKGRIRSDTDNSEYTADATSGFDSFDSDGFTVAADTSSLGLNVLGAAQGSWNFKANGAGVLNEDGAIDSTVSVNATSKFSIVEYTGTASTTTVGHGLGVVPTFIMVKNLSSTQNWRLYHVSMGNTKEIYLDLNNGETTASTTWNDTTPTSSVFTVGTTYGVNKDTESFIAYCFADVPGYSKFGSYYGNSSADGTFIYTGFKPSWVCVKRINSTSNWRAWDNINAGYNGSSCIFHLNLTDQESCGDNTDFLSNGFKSRTTSTDQNANGGTYMYAAFAEEPLVANVGSGLPATAR